MSQSKLPEFEIRVLNYLWGEGALTARQLTDRMYPSGSHSAYMTVKKLLERLEAKGLVSRSVEQRAHRFEAAVDREAVVAGELEGIVDGVCDGSIAPLMNALVQGVSLSQSQREELEELIASFQKNETKRERGARE